MATRPAHLAGRDRELRVIEKALDEIAGPRNKETGILNDSPLTPIKIVGPRGVGKTVLLSEAREMAKARKVAVVKIAVLKNLDPESPLAKRILALVDEQKLSNAFLSQLARIKEVRLGPAGLVLNSDKQHTLFEEALETCLAQRPLALLLDEAMEYDPEALGMLLQICQQMIDQKFPLAVLLAGTPDLDQNLAKAKASFIDRTEDLYINAIAPAATREGLRKPFADSGAQVTDKALELMEGMTDNYPFLIQGVGYEVWEAMEAARQGRVTATTVRLAEEGIQRRRDGFYQKVYGKIHSAVMLRHARKIMTLLQERGGRATRVKIVDSLAEEFEENGQRQALDAFHALVDLGFIWSKDNLMEPGIPSFFKYCERMEQADADHSVTA